MYNARTSKVIFVIGVLQADNDLVAFRLCIMCRHGNNLETIATRKIKIFILPISQSFAKLIAQMLNAL